MATSSDSAAVSVSVQRSSNTADAFATNGSTLEEFESLLRRNGDFEESSSNALIVVNTNVQHSKVHFKKRMVEFWPVGFIARCSQWRLDFLLFLVEFLYESYVRTCFQIDCVD